MMDIKMKRALTQCTLTMMVNCDVQNTEGDYEKIKGFVNSCVFSYHDIFTEETTYNSKQMVIEVQSIIEPLWEFYFENLHDGYNVGGAV